MKNIRNFIKKCTHPFLKSGLKLYYSKPRKYCYESVCVQVHPDVFPPHLTFSTKILLDFIKDLKLNNKTFLELGCGSGIISLLASQKGAIVTASDVNKIALNYLEESAIRNNLKVRTVYSDLFDEIDKTKFDFIIVNPPYYPKKAKNVKEKAWFCGEHFEYFKKLFSQLTEIEFDNFYMILSQDCEIEKIVSIAQKNNLKTQEASKIKNSFENNFIYKITKMN
ncbi:class I SAM-dependent methyltransferase [Flavobacterium sp. NRK F10]|uniref:methyltransferase n=1 Tax=Flavobacterium sp. NRK F10 TaxID=2954931 RepID=UPI002090DE84|nr:class I SAM-dependent methyltransferase [Flavobacterium sp. NRK F10]MCO6175106.1 class I SAM-dependent methyltransferase [Flavobacterium sp. NRK F10]